MSRIGENIKKARMESGMTQKVLAKKLGVSETFVKDVELGRKVLTEALISKVSKVFNKELNDISMSVEVESMEQVTQEERVRPQAKKGGAASADQVNDTWSGAFASVLKSVPIYNYSLNSISGTKLLPIQNNKVEGFAQDKVFYLEIEDDDMMGFRIFKGDLAFAHHSTEIENNSFCLIQHDNERIIRQIRKLDSTKALLISNKGSLRTETVNVKDIKVIAKLERIEFKL